MSRFGWPRTIAELAHDVQRECPSASLGVKLERGKCLVSVGWIVPSSRLSFRSVEVEALGDDQCHTDAEIFEAAERAVARFRAERDHR